MLFYLGNMNDSINWLFQVLWLVGLKIDYWQQNVQTSFVESNGSKTERKQQQHKCNLLYLRFAVHVDSIDQTLWGNTYQTAKTESSLRS